MLRMLAKIAGQCIAMTRAIVPGKLLLCNVYRILAKKSNWENELTIDPHCLKDLFWWDQAINKWNGAPLLAKQPEVQVETDASGTGSDGACRTLQIEASGVWCTSVAFKPSNYRELLVVLLSVQSFGEQLKGKSVQILNDNVTTVAYVNHVGGQDWLMSTLTTTIFTVCQGLNIQISACQIVPAGITLRMDVSPKNVLGTP